MTDRIYPLTYEGPNPKGHLALPDRNVRFTRGEPVAFTAAEARTLDDNWTGDRPAPDGPPAGSVSAVLFWVDGDRDRAHQALDAENAATRPRASLVAQLEELTTKTEEV